MAGQKAGKGQWGGITSLPGSARTNLRTASGHVNRGFGLKFYRDESECRVWEVPAS
jgi:hypothetical protein